MYSSVCRLAGTMSLLSGLGFKGMFLSECSLVGIVSKTLTEGATMWLGLPRNCHEGLLGLVSAVPARVLRSACAESEEFSLALHPAQLFCSTEHMRITLKAPEDEGCVLLNCSRPYLKTSL